MRERKYSNFFGLFYFVCNCEIPDFQKYRYFMLYRIEDDVVYVDDIFHELQDYENRMI